MNKVKCFKQFINENINDNILVKIGNFILTKKDLESKYKDRIIKHFGNYNEDTINKTLLNLYEIENLYKNGGFIYRVIWLKDEKDFNFNDLGYHWLSNKSDINNIIDLFTFRYNKKDIPYIIKAHTPPKNVKIPYDYFNNIEENEVLVINDKLLNNIELIKY